MSDLAYLSLGANLGPAKQTIKQAVCTLAVHPELTLCQCSPLYRSAPLKAEGAPYCNAVVAVETQVAAQALLAICLAIEQQFGRERTYRNAPRMLDIDLCLFGTQQINLPNLIVPHPRMMERAFVLLPLLDIAPSIEIPGYGPAKDFLPQVLHQSLYQISSL